jgi:endonuclease-3
MTSKKEKARRIARILDEHFPDPPIPLDHTDAYTLLVSVVLSAQCTDVRVNQVTPKLFARASTPAAMTTVSVDEIREIIKPCGLSPTKARNIRALSEILDHDFGGEVPSKLEELQSLPGVGRKTAQVVMAQAFGLPAFPVDTHIFRLARRWGLSEGNTVEKVETDLRALFPEASWNKVHLQIIWFGRTFCPARSHDASACPICSWAAPGAVAE